MTLLDNKGVLKTAVEKDLALIEDKIKSFDSIKEIVDLGNHFDCFFLLEKFFDELKAFLDTYEHFIPRIEGIHSYEHEDDDCKGEDTAIAFEISGGGDGDYDWGRIFKACTKNTLKFIKAFGGTVIMYDGCGEWTYG